MSLEVADSEVFVRKAAPSGVVRLCVAWLGRANGHSVGLPTREKV